MSQKQSWIINLLLNQSLREKRHKKNETKNVNKDSLFCLNFAAFFIF